MRAPNKIRSKLLSAFMRRPASAPKSSNLPAPIAPKPRWACGARSPLDAHPDALPQLTLSAPALAALCWSARRSPDEFCFWGVLETAPEGLLLREAILARHQGSPAYSVPDMDWFADLLADRHEQEGLDPWQLACWIHTHPAGLNRPSGVDRATFAQHFGRQRLAVMLIMTRDLEFWGELSLNLPPLPGLPPARTTSPLRLVLPAPQEVTDEALCAQLEQQYLKRVTPLSYRASNLNPAADSPSELLDGEDWEQDLWLNPESEDPLPEGWLEGWPSSSNDDWPASWPFHPSPRSPQNIFKMEMED